MKTEAEIRAMIAKLENDYEHILTGSIATIAVNTPRALQQLASESELRTLYWVLGKQFKSRLKGVNT